MLLLGGGASTGAGEDHPIAKLKINQVLL